MTELASKMLQATAISLILALQPIQPATVTRLNTDPPAKVVAVYGASPPRPEPLQAP